MRKEALKNKRGVSDVITTVLIILLVLASTAIIGGIILKNLGDASEKIEVGFNTVSLSIPQQSVKVNPFLQSVNFNLVRNPGEGSVKAFNVVVEDSSGKKNVVRVDQSISELETKPISVSYAGSGLLDVKKVSVAPILSTSKGKEIPNEISVAYQTSSSDINRALNFFSISSAREVDLGNKPSFNFGTGPFTVSLWINLDVASTSPGPEIFSKYADPTHLIHLRWRADLTPNQLQFEINRLGSGSGGINLISSGTSLNKGFWYHVVAVRDVSGKTDVYIDGVSRATGTYSGNVDNAANFLIGRGYNGRGDSTYRWLGYIDEVRIYNKALAASEIQAIYNAGKGQYGNPEPNLVAGYHFDEGSGTLARDYSGNGNDGTLIGSVSYV